MVEVATLEVAKCPDPKSGGFPLTPHLGIKFNGIIKPITYNTIPNQLLLFSPTFLTYDIVR